MNRIMIDLETLSTSSYATILSLGAVKMDPNPNIILPTFYVEFDIETQTSRKLDHSTLKYWLEKKDLLPEGKTDFAAGLQSFVDWAGPIDEIWAKSPDFDCAIMETAFDNVGIEHPWDFRKRRDVRTAIALYDSKRNNPGRVHHALDDALHQALQVMDVLMKFEVKL